MEGIKLTEWKSNNIPSADIMNIDNGVITTKIGEIANKCNSIDNSIGVLANKCSNIDDFISKLDAKLLNRFYPVGCIFTTTNAELNTPESVATHFGGGQWSAFGAGRVIVGAGNGFGINSLGGDANRTLGINNMPSHNHALSNVSHKHTISIPNHSHSASQTAHSHTATQDAHAHGFRFRLRKPGYQSEWHPQAADGNHNNGVDSANYTTDSSKPAISVEAVTPSVTVKDAATTGSIDNTTISMSMGSTGNGQNFSIMQPYVTCYMWKRIS